MKQFQRTISKKDKLPKLTQEEIENLNRTIISKDIKFIIKNTPHKEAEPDGFTTEVYQTFKELLPVLHNSKKQRKRKHFPTHSMRPTLLETKIRQRHHKKTTDQCLLLIQMQSPQQNTCKPTPATYKKDYTI